MKPMLIDHQWSLSAFSWGWFYKISSRCTSLNCVWKLHFIAQRLNHEKLTIMITWGHAKVQNFGSSIFFILRGYFEGMFSDEALILFLGWILLYFDSSAGDGGYDDDGDDWNWHRFGRHRQSLAQPNGRKLIAAKAVQGERRPRKILKGMGFVREACGPASIAVFPNIPLLTQPAEDKRKWTVLTKTWL